MQPSKFSQEQKQQLLANLDIEVAHRTRQLESWLSDTLAAFRNRHERQLAKIPHLVRGMMMAEFGDKYDGDVQAALRGLQKERLAVDVAPIDRNAMKRKWAPPHEENPETHLAGSGKDPENNQARAAKNPRIAPPSPTKKLPPLPGSTAPSRIQPPKTPGSPYKVARIPSASVIRAASPTKPTAASLARQVTNPSPVRVPSITSFKPAIPKTPAYPPPPRWPRKDEGMLSINGSPLMNPYELGIEWLAREGDAADAGTGTRSGTGTREGDGGGDGVGGRMGLRRTASSIVIRRDPSATAAAGKPSNGLNNRHHQAGRPRSNSQSRSQSHSRSDSRTVGSNGIATSNSSHMAARVAVPTRDGHLLEFDPLLTSPGALDNLVGITDSAKKQAREDVSNLVQVAVAKWSIK